MSGLKIHIVQIDSAEKIKHGFKDWLDRQEGDGLFRWGASIQNCTSESMRNGWRSARRSHRKLMKRIGAK